MLAKTSHILLSSSPCFLSCCTYFTCNHFLLFFSNFYPLDEKIPYVKVEGLIKKISFCFLQFQTFLFALPISNNMPDASLEPKLYLFHCLKSMSLTVWQHFCLFQNVFVSWLSLSLRFNCHLVCCACPACLTSFDSTNIYSILYSKALKRFNFLMVTLCV